MHVFDRINLENDDPNCHWIDFDMILFCRLLPNIPIQSKLKISLIRSHFFWLNVFDRPLPNIPFQSKFKMLSSWILWFNLFHRIKFENAVTLFFLFESLNMCWPHFFILCFLVQSFQPDPTIPNQNETCIFCPQLVFVVGYLRPAPKFQAKFENGSIIKNGSFLFLWDVFERPQPHPRQHHHSSLSSCIFVKIWKNTGH